MVIRVNGSTISINGRHNKVTVDGKDIDLGTDKEITVVCEGNVEKLEVDACDRVEVKGNAGNVKTASGDVRCGDITGNVQTMSGDVHASKIGGNVSTMSGDVN